MTKDDLNILEYNSFYQNYIDKAAGLDIKDGFNTSMGETYELLRGIDEDKLSYRYDKGKWTIKEVVQHLIDTERIFAYRALRLARKDQTPLPGFEQGDYMGPSEADTRNFENLLKEYVSVRESTIFLFNSFPTTALTNKGVVNNSDVSVRAIGFIIMGHERHHCQIINDRYL